MSKYLLALLPKFQFDLQRFATDEGNIIVGLTSLSVDSADVGYTQDGVAFRREITFLDIKADQFIGTIAKKITDVLYFLSSTMKESTLENLVNVFEGTVVTDGVSGDKTLDLEVSSSDPTEHDLEFVGPAPGSGFTSRTLTGHRAVSIGNGEHTYAKDGELVYPVEYELLPDFDQEGDDLYGSIVDAAAGS